MGEATKETGTFAALVREYFPDADDEWVDYVLWTHTGFPAFWGKDETVATQLRRQLQEYKDRCAREER